MRVRLDQGAVVLDFGLRPRDGAVLTARGALDLCDLLRVLAPQADRRAGGVPVEVMAFRGGVGIRLGRSCRTCRLHRDQTLRLAEQCERECRLAAASRKG